MKEIKTKTSIVHFSMLQFDILVHLSLIHACISYEFRCPHPSQWNVRSTALCKGEKKWNSYSCLYDEHEHSYSESCSKNSDFVRPGQKYVRFFHRSNVDCNKSRYQPIKFWSGMNSRCILLKSLCNDFGQKVYTVGTTREDTKCYCDYKKGFVYITKPSRTCYCVLSKEDCSCYYKGCTDTKSLQSGHGCLLKDQIEFIPECFQSINDSLLTVSTDIPLPKLPKEVGPNENDVPLFRITAVVLSILMIPSSVAIIMLFCKKTETGKEKPKNKSPVTYKMQLEQRGMQKTPMMYEISVSEHPIKGTTCELVPDTGVDSFARLEKRSKSDVHIYKSINAHLHHQSDNLTTVHSTGLLSKIAKKSINLNEGNSNLENVAHANEVEIKGQSPFFEACIDGNLEMVIILTQKGCNVNEKNKEYQTPLIMACFNGYIEIVKHLIQLEVSIDSRDKFGQTAVFYATEKCHVEVIKILITKKCDVNIANNSGVTPFVHSLLEENFEIANLLIEGGAHTNEINNINETTLWIACNKGTVRAVEYLMEVGIDVNKTNKNQQTALWLACNNGKLEIVKHLIKNHCDVNKPDIRSWTPMKAASCCGFHKICEFLISKDVDVDKADDEGWTPLMSACREGHYDCVETLVKNGADCKLSNCQGKTALWLACRYGRISIVNLLLSESDINMCDHKNRSPLEAASGHTDVCELLRSVGCKSKDITE